MPQLRVTEGSITTRVMANLQRSVTRGGRIQEQLSSGKLISRPSDSPTGTVSSMQLRGETRVNQQYSRNADDGLGWLGTVDSTLTESMPLVNRARDLIIQGLNSGVSTPQSRAAMKIEVENIRDSLIGMANTTYLGRPVLGGTTRNTAAYTSTGGYQGDDGQVLRTVGSSAKVKVGENGPDVYGAAGSPDQLFELLGEIANNLRDGKMADLRTNLTDLDTAGNRLKSRLADVGARYNRISQMHDMAEERMISLRGQVSNIEDIDLPQTIMEMQMHETSYQAALAATAKVIQPSLLNYLR